MDTQNTPVHVRLWHRGFWLLAIANLLLCMAVYMLLPVLPSWLTTQGFTPKGVAAVMSVYGAGMFLAGPFCGYWVQHYRRNHVCRTAILVMVASLLLFYALGRPSVAALMGGDTLRASILALRIVMGAAFGLSQMVLCSTLIIDSCESFQRTEANYAVAWFGRFALSLGPLAALVCQRFLAPDLLFLLIAGVAFVSVLLIQMVDFPFRAPDENQHMVSLDRFFLPHGWLLFLHLMCITMVAGMLLSVSHNMAFYAMLMVGFFLAVLSEKFVFADADLKSEVVCGLLLIIAALFMMLRMQSGLTSLSHYVPPVLFGLGIGIIGSRFLLFFIKLSRHCQRGTSQSSFILAWELGISIGLFLGFAFFHQGDAARHLYLTAIVITLVNLLLYHFFMHRWYITHKNR